jgi:hypothetical protein
VAEVAVHTAVAGAEVEPAAAVAVVRTPGEAAPEAVEERIAAAEPEAVEAALAVAEA